MGKSDKTVHRSFRYSAEVAAVLENFGNPASSINDRFEQLILYCNLELPEVEKKIKKRRAELAEIEEEYRKVLKKTSDMRAVGRELDSIMVQFGTVKSKLSEILEKCNT